jgi:hypothetical protein
MNERSIFERLALFLLTIFLALASGLAGAGAGLNSGSWTSIGPDNLPGRVTSIAIHPTLPNKMWIGTVGGIWHSADAGGSWAKVNDFLPSLVISSIVISRSHPNIMFATTGEVPPNPYPDSDYRERQRGVGILRSLDGGLTWNVLPSTAGSEWLYTKALAVHPANPNIVVTGTRSRLYRSTDGGDTWVRNTAFGGVIHQVLFDPADPNRMVMHIDRVIYRSSNAGETWSSAGYSPQTLIDAGGPVLAFGPQAGMVYAAVEMGSPSVCCNLGGKVMRSAAPGIDFVNIGQPNHLGSRLPPAQAIWVDPTNGNHLIVGGEDLHRSTDGGVSWVRISSGAQAGSVASGIHAIVASPGYNGSTNRTIFVGTARGLFKAQDIQAVTATDVGWTPLNNGLATTEFFGAAGHANANGRIIGGTTQGSLVYSGSGKSWTAFHGGEGGRVAIDPVDGNVIYATILPLRVHRSDTGGAPAMEITAGIGRSLLPRPIVLDPNNRDAMLAGGLNLWRSTNVRTPGPTWTNIRPFIGTDFLAETISSIAVAPGNSSVVWLGTHGKGLYTTANATAPAPTWSRVGGVNGIGIPATKYHAVVFDRHVPNAVYIVHALASDNFVTTTPNIRRTADGGATWTDLPALPQPARALTQHPTIPGILYAGTEAGVFTREGEGNWSPVNVGPANVRVDELFWIGTTLYAATHGRGMFHATPAASTGTFTLNVGKDGAGTGPVTSTPSGIACGSVCAFEFGAGTTVTLTATPNSGSYFGGWTGCDSQTGTSCVVSMTGSRAVKASFTTTPPDAWVVTVVKQGTGNGSVTSSPSGIVCGSGCQAGFGSTSVTLTAAADAKSTFTGWTSPYCTGTGPCVLQRSVVGSSVSVTANFAKAGFPLTVTKSGAGSGPVTSSPSGISCGSTCSANFVGSVTLTATPNPGSVFGGWSGACTGMASTCTVTMDQARTVTARFDLPGKSLSVNKGGDGSGSVTSSPAGIVCGSACTAMFPNESTVVLTATPHAGSVFAGWGSTGDCTGGGTCTLVMSANRGTTAYFSKAGQPLVVAKSGTGSGSVASAPAGISCGSVCQANFATGSTVTLTVSPHTGSAFAGWSGACTGTGTCVVTMNNYQYVSATFNRTGYRLTVSKSGTGSGPVSSSPAGISCGSACSADFAPGTTVTLSASPGANSEFAGWSGACSGTSTCVLTLNADVGVTASFIAVSAPSASTKSSPPVSR